jgi:hypothetical protein
MESPKMGDEESATKIRGIKAQQTFMDRFSAHGLQNPKKLSPARVLRVIGKGYHQR